MYESTTIERIFLDLCESLKKSDDFFEISFSNDSNPLWSFYDLIISDKPLTKSQSVYVIKILRENKHQLKTLNYDLDRILENPKWKHPFRVIDQTRKVSVEQDQEGVIWYCFQFPYSFKETFDSTFDLKYSKVIVSKWDSDRKLRKIKLYSLNFLEVDEFVNQHRFVIDDSYLCVKSQIEEIINFQDTIEKKSQIINDRVVLKNASRETECYFEDKKSNILEKDLFLAKKIGYCYETTVPRNLFEKISSSESNSFWSKDINLFFEIYGKIQGRVCIILNQQIDYKKWIKNFLDLSDQNFIDRRKIKVCFREERNSNFNEWIKENSLGGKISEGEIYIFLNSPAKWLYEDLNSVNIILMTDLIPNVNKNVQFLSVGHPFVLYVNENKPTTMREIKIVNL